MAHQAGTLDIFERDVGAEVRYDDAAVAQPACCSGGGARRQHGLEDQPDDLSMGG
jgi:hypothetical protein